MNADSEPVLNFVPPPKPVRIPTIKAKQKPEVCKKKKKSFIFFFKYFLFFLQYLQSLIKSTSKSGRLITHKNNVDDDNDYENEYERIKEEKIQKFSYLGPPPNLLTLNGIRNDITMPKLGNFRTIFSLNNFKCNLIQDQTKRLDRNALSEINSIFLHSDSARASDLALSLAKCITYEDIQLLRYNYDFGLGIYNGIELICLTHGNFIRIDLIDRHKTFKLFICLLISLCQISVEHRCKLIIMWIDCAFYLFEKFKNLYAFNYVMEALNHEKVSNRLIN